MTSTDLYRQARRLALDAAQPLGPSDLQRHLRVGWSHACRLLEELEGDGLLGSLSINGVRRWSPAFPVDPARRLAFRKARPTHEPEQGAATLPSEDATCPTRSSAHPPHQEAAEQQEEQREGRQGLLGRRIHRAGRPRKVRRL